MVLGVEMKGINIQDSISVKPVCNNSWLYFNYFHYSIAIAVE